MISERGKICLIVFASCVLAAMAVAGYCSDITPLFFDSFEQPTNLSLWTKGPTSWAGQQAHDSLAGSTIRIRTGGSQSAMNPCSYRDAWNSQHILANSYTDGVYLKCWMYDDHDKPYPIPVPLYTNSDEEWPNSCICLTNTNAPGSDSMMVGLIGHQGYVNRPTYNPSYFFDDAVSTTTNGIKPLDGTSGNPTVARREGWRKYTILLRPYTGQVGDVQFFIDDKLVYSGSRATSPLGGPVPVDTIILGGQWWTMSWFWFDQLEFDSTSFTQSGTTTSFASPQGAASIQDARNQPDGTWVRLDSKVVTANFNSNILSWSQGGGIKRGDGVQLTADSVTQTVIGNEWPGYFAIQDDDTTQTGGPAPIPGSGALMVSSSYQAQVNPSANTGERVQVIGRMRTNEAGMRYLDAFKVTQTATGVSQPHVVCTSLANLSSSALDGRLVKVWGKVITIPGSSPASVFGQERNGDNRYYILIDDGSGGSPVKCYIPNLLSTLRINYGWTTTFPSVSAGQFVSAVGVLSKEVLVPGATDSTGVAQKSIWIRGVGDLTVIQ